MLKIPGNGHLRLFTLQSDLFRSFGAEFLSVVNNNRVNQSRSLRRIKLPALPFKPNTAEAHQVFYPSIKSIIEKQKHLNENFEFVDIGIVPTSETETQHADSQSANEEQVEITGIDPENLISLIKLKDDIVYVDYDEIAFDWARSSYGQRMIMEIANHFKIYHHLFGFTESKLTRLEPEFTNFWPFPETPMDPEMKMYMPGVFASQTKRVDSSKVYVFTPVTPIYVEFPLIKDPKNDEIEVSPVYNGNHIKPKYTLSKPYLVIDATTIEGKNKPKSSLNNLIGDGVKIIGDTKNYYTVMLVNLDSQFGNSKPICHWMACNIKSSSDDKAAKYDELISFLPPYAMKGFGYSRYVFLVLKQESQLKDLDKIDDFVLEKRMINPLSFINGEKAKSKPVGLSWFQSSWDESCTNIFHKLLDMREPIYEYNQPGPNLAKQVIYPGSAPFNLYLDHFRHQKDINKEVFLERMKLLDPFNYKKLYEEPSLPPNLHSWPKSYPSWQRNVLWKKRTKFGQWRNLRNPTALKLNNGNEDLDYPLWPYPSKLETPMRFPHRWHKNRIIPNPYRNIVISEFNPIQIRDDDMHELRRKEAEDDHAELEKLRPSKK